MLYFKYTGLILLNNNFNVIRKFKLFSHVIIIMRIKVRVGNHKDHNMMDRVAMFVE